MTDLVMDLVGVILFLLIVGLCLLGFIGMLIAIGDWME